MGNPTILDSLFPRIRQGLLAATLSRPGKWWYLSELANFLRTTPSSLQRELSSLVKSGILRRRKDGNRAYFKAESRSPIFTDLRRIVEKTRGVTLNLRKALQPFHGKIVCAFVYGSFARHEAHALSDVDVLVIGSLRLGELLPALRDLEKRLNRDVNVTTWTVRGFRDKIARGEHFSQALLDGPKQFVRGGQRELEAIRRSQHA